MSAVAETQEILEALIEQDPDCLVAQHGPFLLLKTGAVATGEPTYEEWEAALQWCQKVEQCSPFWVGDLLTFGEATYGEMYSQAVEATGHTAGTLMNAVYVAKAVPPERRHAGLAFGLHQEVAALPAAEQTAWLDRAETENLSQLKLRHEIKVARVVASGKTPDLWLMVKCAGPDDQSELAERMKAEGRAVKLHLKNSEKSE